MKLQREPQLESGIEIRDITDQYPEIRGVIQYISVETNRKFDFKEYITDLEILGIPSENVGISFCG